MAPIILEFASCPTCNCFPFVIIHTTISWKLIPCFAPGDPALIGAGRTISPPGNQSEDSSTIPANWSRLVGRRGGSGYWPVSAWVC